MADLKPFKALHYSPEKVQLGNVIAPPYDVISKAEEKALHERDPHNMIRLELGEPPLDQNAQTNRYQEARDFMNEWLKEGVLVSDEAESFYFYEQTFNHPLEKRRLARIGFFARIKLEPFEKKVVFPHEKTHASAKVDRRKLLEATRTNFSPVFFLYEDVNHLVEALSGKYFKEKPLFDFETPDGAHHRLWQVKAGDDLRLLVNSLKGKPVFIADGHHRYETALGFSRDMQAAKNFVQENGSDYALGGFVAFNDPGLLILPIHRVLRNCVHLDKAALFKGIEKHFKVEPTTKIQLELISSGVARDGFGLAFSESECYLLELKDFARAQLEMPVNKPKSWYALDVNQLSYLILEPLLGLSSGKLEGSVFYTPRLEEAFEELKQGRARCAFFVKPVKPIAIKEICEQNEIMPQKSTYFYPKFSSGIVMNRH